MGGEPGTNCLQMRHIFLNLVKGHEISSALSGMVRLVSRQSFNSKRSLSIRLQVLSEGVWLMVIFWHFTSQVFLTMCIG